MPNIVVDSLNNDTRLDKFLASILTNFSRAQIGRMILGEYVKVNDKTITKNSFHIKEGDIISYTEMELKETDIKGEDIPLDIVYEDDDLLVINKPQGMVVHPAPGHYEGTLVNALIAHCPLSNVGGVKRPGIVHRIDKDTSGLIVVAKNDFAHNFLSEQLKDHSMHREYYALVKGTFSEEKGRIKLPISRSKKNFEMMIVDPKGKEAITDFKVMKNYRDYALLDLRLYTGRTHQIRVHLSYIKHPIEGDKVYGRSPYIYENGQMLHAYRLTFVHPTTKKEMTFTCDMPSWFKEVINNLK